jgi:amino acid permease
MGTSLITIPFAVSLAGFWPSVIAIILSWFFLLLTGFLFLEGILANPPGKNIFTITHRYSGIGGAWFSSIVLIFTNYGYFIFFFYLAAPLASEILNFFGLNLPPAATLASLVAILGCCVALGLYATLWFNVVLIIGIVFLVTKSFLIGFTFNATIPITKLQWDFLFIVFPTVINSLYYNTLLPSVAPLLKYNKKQLQLAILFAMSGVAILFSCWLWMAITASVGQSTGLNRLNPQSLSFSSLSRVPLFGKWLPALLVLNVSATSLAVGTILIDFFADMLNISLHRRKGFIRIALCALAFIPPFLINLVPSRFLYEAALYVTDIGPLYLTGLLPVMWAWSARYFYQDKHPVLVFGGKIVLLLIAIFSCFIFYLVGLEIFYQRTFGQ